MRLEYSLPTYWTGTAISSLLGSTLQARFRLPTQVRVPSCAPEPTGATFSPPLETDGNLLAPGRGLFGSL